MAMSLTSRLPHLPLLYNDFLICRNQEGLQAPFHTGKNLDRPSDVLGCPGSRSAFSEIAPPYRCPELLRARSLYEMLNRDQTVMCPPFSFDSIARQFPGEDGTVQCQGCPQRSVDSSSATATSVLHPSSSMFSTPSSSPSAADILSLRPLQVSANLPFPHLSPCAPHHSSVSNHLLWSDTLVCPQHILPRLNQISSLAPPPEATHIKDLPFYRDRSRPVAALTSTVALPQPSFPPLSVSVFRPPVSSFMPADECLSTPPRSSTYTSHLLHLACPDRYPFVKDTFYNDNSPCSRLYPQASPGKQLPTTALKQERHRDRRELRTALHAVRKSKEQQSGLRKTAGTQTQFSGFTCDDLLAGHAEGGHSNVARNRQHTGFPTHVNYLPQSISEYASSMFHTSLDSPLLHPQATFLSHSIHPSHSSFQPCHHSLQKTCSRHVATSTSPLPPTIAIPTVIQNHRRKTSPSTLPPFPPKSNTLSICSHTYSSELRPHDDLQSTAINLSVPGPTPISSLTPPSESLMYKNDDWCVNKSAMANRRLASVTTVIPNMVVQVSDEAIEEHFRRSLSKFYELSSCKEAATDKICSVDDHFARALGDHTWTEIKGRIEPTQSDASPGTVDAHFAKALGAATWRRLNVDNKITNGTSTSHTLQYAPETQHTSEQQQHTSEQQQHTSVPQQHTSEQQQHTSEQQQHTSEQQQHTSEPQQHTSEQQQHTSEQQQCASKAQNDQHLQHE